MGCCAQETQEVQETQSIQERQPLNKESFKSRNSNAYVGVIGSNQTFDNDVEVRNKLKGSTNFKDSTNNIQKQNHDSVGGCGG